MKRVVIYISDHGFGHAARTIGLVRQLKQQNYEIIIKNSNAYNFLKFHLPLHKIIKFKTDVGPVSNIFSEHPDYEKTFSLYNNWINNEQKWLDKETQFFKNRMPDLIISDISPIGIRLANKLHVPSITIANFTWIDILENFPYHKYHDQILDWLYASFEMTDLALEYLEKARSKIIRRQSGLTTDEEINTTQSNINQIEETLPGLKLTFEGFEKEYQSMEFKIKNLSKKILDIKAAQGFQRDWDNENINKKNLDENAKVLEKKAALMQGEEFPSIFIYNKVKDFGDQLESKEKKGEIPSPWNKKILKIILNENKCICGEKLDSEKEKIINERFQDATTGEFNQKITLLGGASLTMENSFKNFSSEYTEHTKAIEKNDKKRLESETRLAEIKENLIKLDKKEVNDILNEQDDLATKKENSYTLFLQAKNFYNDKRKELIGLRNSLESMHKKVGLSQKIQKEINKIDLVIDYIKSESQKTEEKSIGIIERELNENIKGGFNKNYKASIDKKDYSIRLTKNGGQPVSKSSGEGEFLKYAFVSAILNLSKGEFKNEIKFLSDTFVSPLVIDAPFSGLGPGYKKQCIDSIYNASEQLILMMLPEVLNKGVGDKIKNNIGKKYVIFYSTTEKEWDRDISNIEYQGQEVPIVQLNQKITGSALAEI